MSDTTRMITQAIIAGLVAALVLLVGIRQVAVAQWGGETESSSAEPTAEPTPTSQPVITSAAEPCSLVTDAEAEAVFGTGVTTMSDANQCTYVTNDISGRGLSITAAADLPSAAGISDAMQQLADTLGGTRADATLGAESHIVTSEAVAELSVLTDDGELLVLVMTMPQGTASEITAQLNDLGTTALSRL